MMTKKIILILVGILIISFSALTCSSVKDIHDELSNLSSLLGGISQQLENAKGYCTNNQIEDAIASIDQSRENLVNAQAWLDDIISQNFQQYRDLNVTADITNDVTR